ncbi:TPA: hypothetical protein OQU49_004276 [Shigella flexneri]|nr:hypothetical protein [Shigella flexneri]
MLLTLTGRMVRSWGDGETAGPGDGRVDLTPATHGVHDGALRNRETVRALIEAGQMESVDLTPGTWSVSIRPDKGSAWPEFMIDLTEGMSEPVDLATLAPVVVVDGAAWAKGDPGPAGASVTGGRDNGDGTVSFELSDGTYTDPVTVPPGPAGRGIASVSDADGSSVVTITYTDGTSSTVQAIMGAAGRTPVITWDGTTIVTDGVPGPDLKGAPGADSTVPGPANSLTIGTVSSGVTASASIAGDSPAQVLSLVLPKGDKGDKGDPGQDGTATLPDTGWRLLTNSTVWSSGGVQVRRLGPFVLWKVGSGIYGISQWNAAFTNGMSVAGFIPASFRPEGSSAFVGLRTDSDKQPAGALEIQTGGTIQRRSAANGQLTGDVLIGVTSAPFPTMPYPGTPA